MKQLVNSAGSKAFKAKVNNGKTAMVFQREERDRHPLRPFYGPSVAKMMEKIYTGRDAEAGLKEELARLYQANLQKQIDKVVGT